ncbi:MAG: type II toxin-antitoxin system MqsA family antitoxin, partial [Acidobacteriota bacterium]
MTFTRPKFTSWPFCTEHATLKNGGGRLLVGVRLANEASQPTLRCENCGRGAAEIRHLTRSYGKGSSLLVVEIVPVVSCPRCGATYLTAGTLHETDRIKAHRRSLARRRNVAVAEFVWPRTARHPPARRFSHRPFPPPRQPLAPKQRHPPPRRRPPTRPHRRKTGTDTCSAERLQCAIILAKRDDAP